MTGIFKWNKMAIYNQEGALKVYKSKKAAEKACRKMNEEDNYARNLVTREIR